MVCFRRGPPGPAPRTLPQSAAAAPGAESLELHGQQACVFTVRAVRASVWAQGWKQIRVEGSNCSQVNQHSQLARDGSASAYTGISGARRCCCRHCSGDSQHHGSPVAPAATAEDREQSQRSNEQPYLSFSACSVSLASDDAASCLTMSAAACTSTPRSRLRWVPASPAAAGQTEVRSRRHCRRAFAP